MKYPAIYVPCEHADQLEDFLLEMTTFAEENNITLLNVRLQGVSRYCTNQTYLFTDSVHRDGHLRIVCPDEEHRLVLMLRYS